MSDSPRPHTPPLPHDPHEPRRQSENFDESPLSIILSAALFLYVGFGMSMRGISGDAIYDMSVNGFTWMARLVGIALLVLLAMTYARVPGAAALNLLTSVIATGGCLICGAIRIAFGDMQGWLLILLGLVNAGSIRRAWPRR